MISACAEPIAACSGLMAVVNKLAPTVLNKSRTQYGRDAALAGQREKAFQDRFLRVAADNVLSDKRKGCLAGWLAG